MNQVSVIVPTYNRLDRLKRVLAAFEKQTYPLTDFEVVVVSDGSSDGTDDYLRTVETPLRLTAVFQPNQGVAAARNHGLERATGEFILFVDDDVVPSPHLIEEHLRYHNSQEASREVVVMGPMLTPAPEEFKMAPWVQWEQAMLVKQYDDMMAGRWEPTARQFYTGNTSLARHHLLATGGFDPRFRRAEDVELAYRLADRGLRFLFNADAIGYHYAERSFNSWIAIPYAYGRNDVMFTHDKGQSWLLPTIFYEFHGRNPLIKFLTRACLDRKLLSNLVIQGLKHAARLGDMLGVAKVPRMSYSGIFNLRHYQGIADELGGREEFFAQVAKCTTYIGPPQPEPSGKQVGAIPRGK
ncbi:MAG: glycosyltransferase family 2 protein [Ardenticatenaceae bacterium]